MTLELTLAAGDALTDSDDELETDDVFRDDDVMLTEVDDIFAIEYETLAGEEKNESKRTTCMTVVPNFN